MPNLPIRRPGGGSYLDRLQALAEQREHNRTELEVLATKRTAKVAAVRVQGAALVAHVGLVNIEMLSNLEVSLARRGGPMIDDRARSIVDSYTHVVGVTLGRLAMED